MLLITKGHISSWSIAAYYENSSIKTMVYKNINRRILILAKEGYVEEVPYTKRTPHGRIDYRLTSKGLTYLIPYLFANPEELKGVLEYTDKFGVDKSVITIALEKHVTKSLITVIEYYSKLNPKLKEAIQNKEVDRAVNILYETQDSLNQSDPENETKARILAHTLYDLRAEDRTKKKKKQS